MRSHPRFAALLLLSFCASAANRPLRAEEPPPYKIVLPSGEAHELLPKTCGVCHKDESWKFFLVAAPAQDALEQALVILKSKGAVHAETAGRPKNAHAATACIFCHLETPKAGDDSVAMAFRTLDGSPAGIAEVEKLCEMCHPKSKAAHARVVAGDAAADLSAAGIPTRDGKASCSSCHDMHREEVGPAGVRKEYMAFAAASAKSNPHGNRAACRACHPGELPTSAVAVFTEDDPRKRCARCHPQDHARIHPVDAAPTDKTYPMSFLTYPLGAEGRLTCSTCHDHPCRPDGSKGNPRFLRGGPYSSFVDFCYRCHPKAGAGALNPHEQVDDDGKVLEGMCTFCHKTPPSSEAYDPEELLYVYSMVELCIRCHDQGPHPTVNHLVEASERLVVQLKNYEKRHKVILPLDPQNRVVCSTCHNPHDKGVLRDEAALGAGELHRWRVPSFAELCTPCHTRYD